MIQIKAVDAENIWDVCGLASRQDSLAAAAWGQPCCNAVFLAETKFHPHMHPQAIYSNHSLVGFFLYTRAENQAETATILRFMIDDRFRQKGLEEKALEHILHGLKIQGVKKVALMLGNADESMKLRCLSLGFRFTGQNGRGEGRYELEWQP